MNSVKRPFSFSFWRTVAVLAVLWTALVGAVSRSSALTLAWDEDPTEEIQGYRVHYGTTSSVYSTTIDAGGDTVVQITGLLPNTTYYFAVTAYNVAGLESLPSDEISFTTPSDPLADHDADGLPDIWESLNGLNPGDNSSTQGALGDFDGDGLNNLMEYAFDLDPQVPGIAPIPSPVLLRNPADGLDYLVLSYSKRVDDLRLSYIVQGSTDLKNWIPASVEEAAPSVASASGNTVTVSIRILPAVSAIGDAKTFVRVSVSVPTETSAP